MLLNVLVYLTSIKYHVVPGPVTLDTDYKSKCFLEQVKGHLFCNHLTSFLYTHIQILMSASPTMEVAITIAITLMEVTHVSAIMATNLTVMDTLVKVRLAIRIKQRSCT